MYACVSSLSFLIIFIISLCLPFQNVDGLPTAQTCFFQLTLPRYTSREVLAEKLLYAIRHCRSIDTDNYMLRRNNGEGDSDESDFDDYDDEDDDDDDDDD